MNASWTSQYQCCHAWTNYIVSCELHAVRTIMVMSHDWYFQIVLYKLS